MPVQEKIIRKGGIQLCAESFGRPGDPAILLIMGATASLVWWEGEFCEGLADRGFFVIRYDNRDTGKSTTYPPGEPPPYSVLDMAGDVLTVMDGYSLKRAHLVGMSLGGMLAQIVAIQHPERVQSLTLIASSVWEDRPDLPQIDQKVLDYHAAAATLDWTNQQTVIDYLVGGWRVLNGSRHPFDEQRVRTQAENEVRRAERLLSMFNHAQLTGGEELYGQAKNIHAPTLIIHGTEDIVLPFVHAEALLETIPGAQLLVIEGGGHEIHSRDWGLIIDTIADHVLPHTET